MPSPVGKMKVGGVSHEEQIGGKQVHNLEKLGGATCQNNGYITMMYITMMVIHITMMIT